MIAHVSLENSILRENPLTMQIAHKQNANRALKSPFCNKTWISDTAAVVSHWIFNFLEFWCRDIKQYCDTKSHEFFQIFFRKKIVSDFWFFFSWFYPDFTKLFFSKNHNFLLWNVWNFGHFFFVKKVHWFEWCKAEKGNNLNT